MTDFSNTQHNFSTNELASLSVQSFEHSVQPPPKVQLWSLTSLFHRNRFFDQAHFSPVERQCVEVWFGFERNKYFFQALGREERKITQKEIARNDVTRAFDIRNTGFLPTWTSTSQSCTEPRQCWGERDRWPSFCQCRSSRNATGSRGHAFLWNPS